MTSYCQQPVIILLWTTCLVNIPSLRFLNHKNTPSSIPQLALLLRYCAHAIRAADRNPAFPSRPVRAQPLTGGGEQPELHCIWL